ncbi:hypothetical protein AMTR_s00133p00088860 [Amborella trichopoda]|uniref:Uncharacterized protein n=1 Tax=Amborella trichopoda TaxID=13333 RepID=W1P3J1_AMBTC|nr:hypothetical protein AMTR_s00133p00088860 [Amborella trichopoda]
MESYMEGQDNWEIMNGQRHHYRVAEVANGEAMQSEIGAGKALYVLIGLIWKELMDHIKDAKTRNEA